MEWLCVGSKAGEVLERFGMGSKAGEVLERLCVDNHTILVAIIDILIYMETLFRILKSRTFWTIVAMFIIGGVNAISQLIPENLQALIMGILALLATYFKINPSQKY
jgi:hypothetical protein